MSPEHPVDWNAMGSAIRSNQFVLNKTNKSVFERVLKTVTSKLRVLAYSYVLLYSILVLTSMYSRLRVILIVFPLQLMIVVCLMCVMTRATELTKTNFCCKTKYFKLLRRKMNKKHITEKNSLTFTNFTNFLNYKLTF